MVDAHKPATSTRRRRRAAAAGACCLTLAFAGLGRLAWAGTNAIYNAGFSNGLHGWRSAVLARGTQPGYPHILVLDTPFEPLLKCERSQRGHRFLQLNVPAGASASVEQSIIVPVNPGHLMFRAWGQLEPVRVTVSLLSGPFVHRLVTFTPPPLQANPTTCSGRRPLRESLSVARYAGQALTLRIQASSHALTGAIADLDSLSLEAH
jgi:hypothetical protein